ncbi:hypothetical protein ACFW53_20440 [Nocardiopsis dassonvillei]|uniref:hypothetical protein n=1 Tax=Nocardiopsis dassonvillei TaxID=2014 RepID=UPI0036722651
MLNTLTKTRRAGAAAAAALALSLTGCMNTPAEHDARLSKASGVASVTIVMPLGLWEQTKPSYSGSELNDLEPAPLDGAEGERGLVRVNLTGTQLMEYLDDLSHDAHASGLAASSTSEERAAASRVYTAISETVDQITPRTGEDDPAPEVIIDDTVGEQEK